jgi:hypothetical protein
MRSGAYAFWRHHCRLLFRAAGAPSPDLRADILLATLSAEQLHSWLTSDQIPPTDLAAALATTARSLCH